MLQISAKNSNFEIFESALYMKSVSMPLSIDMVYTNKHDFAPFAISSN